MDDSTKNGIWMLILGFIVAGALYAPFWLIRSYNEARVFQKLTGKQVTTWDAMWVDLRVMEGTKE